MPMVAIFAEIAASEAAIIAAEAAAAEAAKIAAAEAATAAATTAATDIAATEAAQVAMQQAAQQTAAQQAGIAQVGNAAANAPLTSEAVNAAAQQANAGIQGLPQGFEQQLQNIQNMSQGPSVQVASTNPAAGLDSLRNAGMPAEPVFNNVGGQGVTTAQTFPVNDAGIASVPPATPPAPNTLPMGIDMPGTYMPPSNALYTPPATTYMAPEPSPLMKGLNSVTDWAQKNPFTAMTGAYGAANMLGLMKPSGDGFNEKEYDGPLTKYRLSDDFQTGSANPEDFQYTPRRYAIGGVMDAEPVQTMSDQNNAQGYQRAMIATGGQVANFAKGGSLSDSIESYQKMLSGKPQATPAKSADVGIYYDQDLDTRYQDALTAAQIRQAKVNQRAYVSPPVAKRPTPMGQLQMASVKPRKQGGGDVEAASGGIMHSSLGGYAAGGNPRLLKGPGDGMSDNIPATINGRQPARLADGEFVIPADVVSHLGNGSTEAGAKQLHAMMNKVRKARTGNPKQGKNIRPQKYMPK
jgi:hypothetical protein